MSAHGRVVIVTGANTGIGYRAAEILCEAGAEVILACRSEVRGNEALNKIKDGNFDAKVSFMQLDLSDYNSVQTFSEAFLASGRPLHILINNAGVFIGTSAERHLADNGHEINMATNHLGHFLLTLLLLPKLTESGTVEKKSRIVIVSSEFHDKANTHHRNSIQELDISNIMLEKEESYSDFQGYKNSKVANMMFGRKLARSVQDDLVTVNIMCPGFIPATEVFRHMSGIKRFVLHYVGGLFRGWFGIKSIDHGAGMIVDLATNEKYEDANGKYFKDFKETVPSNESQDVDRQDRLWLKSLEFVNSAGIHLTDLYLQTYSHL